MTKGKKPLITKANSDSIYSDLGVTPIINAIGSVTLLGGSTPTPEVKQAMNQADAAYVPLEELQLKAGKAIARIANVPAAYVTSGAGSALTLATAAFMAGDDDQKIEQLPSTKGMKSEILIQCRHVYWYDRCLELAGAKLVSFGTSQKTSSEDLIKAIGPNTAAIHYVAAEQSPDPFTLSLEQTIEIAHSHGVPVMVDAAAQIYPLDLVGKYVRMGADFQCVATKYIGAPQSTGIALGTEEMIYKLSLQSFVSYEGRRIRGIGRPQKVDRQEIIGVVAAMNHWMSMDHELRLIKAEQQSKEILRPLQNIPGVESEMLTKIIGHQPFGVSLKVDSSITGVTVHEIVENLKQGTPPIWTRVPSIQEITEEGLRVDGEPRIIIHVFGLNDGEDTIVGERISALLTK